MKKLASIFAAILVLGCMAKVFPPTIPTNAVPEVPQQDGWWHVDNIKDCYRTKQGIQVKAAHGEECPNVKLLEAETRYFFKRMHIEDRWALNGVVLVATQTKREGLMGEMRGDLIFVHWEYRPHISLQTYSHELGHVVLNRYGFWPGWLHCGYEGNPGAAKRACSAQPGSMELLAASEAAGYDKGMLSKWSIFRKAFEKGGDRDGKERQDGKTRCRGAEGQEPEVR